MFERLDETEKRYEELNALMSDPTVIGNVADLQKYAKEQASLTEIVETYRKYKETAADLEGVEEELARENDPEMKEMFEEESRNLKNDRAELEETLKFLLIPKDPNDSKNVIIEIRAGAGGDEAALFAMDLYRMYTRFAEKKGWKTEIMSSSESDIGGFKEVIFLVEGEGAYSQLKYESGAHRVQRVPSTESGGRIHTSAATVAVLPEAEEVDVQIDANDLRIDVFCSSGPGGQSVNTTQSAVRVTHIPTGIVVSCQDEKSQHKNKDKALKVLRSRVLEKAMEEQMSEVADARKIQVGTGDRSEKIRTYNFPQCRVTDHRIGLTLQKLDRVLLGELDEIVSALITGDRAAKLKGTE